MGQVLHESAATTEVVRLAILKPIQALSSCCNALLETHFQLSRHRQDRGHPSLVRRL